MNNYLILLLGVVCAGIGGELFVRGTVGIARWARVAPGIIGATVAAFATSSPELSVAIRAASEGRPQISLGDVLGSNVVNVALILGLALAIAGMKAPRDILRRDYPAALAIPAVTAFLFLDGVLSRLDGILMLGLFLIWMILVVLEVRKQRSAAGEVLGKGRHWVTLLACVSGLAFLVAAGTFIVAGARGIAASYGVSEFVIGATVVAIGTSMPELATTVISKLRGHDEVGLGTVLGSNIFNGLFIVAVAAIICPIQVSPMGSGIACGFGVAALLFVFPGRDGSISRLRGFMLLSLYAAYLAVTLFSGE